MEGFPLGGFDVDPQFFETMDRNPADAVDALVAADQKTQLCLFGAVFDRSMGIKRDRFFHLSSPLLFHSPEARNVLNMMSFR